MGEQVYNTLVSTADKLVFCKVKDNALLDLISKYNTEIDKGNKANGTYKD